MPAKVDLDSHVLGNHFRYAKIHFYLYIIGGLGVLLPIALFAFLAKWVYDFVTELIQPLSTMVIGQGVAAEWVADGVVVLSLIALCFIAGFVVRTRLGGLL